MNKFKMVRYNGNLFPWSETLAALNGAVEVEMTHDEILGDGKPSVGQETVLKADLDLKPGPGWWKNERGTWSNKERIIEEKVETILNDLKEDDNIFTSPQIPLAPEKKEERKEAIKKAVKKDVIKRTAVTKKK